MITPGLSDDEFEHLLRRAKDDERAKNLSALMDRVFEEASAAGLEPRRPVVRFFDPRPAGRER